MRIGDVKLLTGVETATIRYWEDRGCIKSTRTDNKYRSYTQNDVDCILQVKRFREIGIPIANIKLWVDNLVSTKELLTEHLKVLDLHADENSKNRELTRLMLNGNEPDTSADFSEENIGQHEGAMALGVDIGTTTISAQLISLKDKSCIHTYGIEHNAAIKDYEHPHAFAMDANKLCDIAIGLVKAATKVYTNIVAIGFTGQMHGIVCLDDNGDILSPLYTWQNQYGNEKSGDKTVCEIIEETTGKTYPTGYGLVTYYAMQRKGIVPPKTKKIACISDVVVMKLCGDTVPQCHVTNAASLGFFDIKNCVFEYNALEKLGIDRRVLPETVQDYHNCGYFENAQVSVSIGDNQASVLASITEESVLLNIGTSGQVCTIEANPDFERLKNTHSTEIRPFFDNKYICIGATLCGGKALAALADLIAEIGKKLGVSPCKPDIYNLINSCAQQGQGTLKMSTTFLGTRDDPEQKGRIDDITLANFNLAELSYSLTRGIIDELYQLYSRFKTANPQKLVISGNAIRKNPALRRAAEQVFDCEVEESACIEEAAFGAAIFAEKSYQKKRNI